MSFAPNPFMPTEDALTLREWYVRVDDGDAVGPVSADQIARGIKLGRVPTDAMMARFDRSDWANVLDSVAVLTALRAL